MRSSATGGGLRSYNKVYPILFLSVDCNMTEDLKWGVSCYTFRGKNVVLIHGFKNYCVLLFHKGVLLKDKSKVLIQQTENVQSARQLRFPNLDKIRMQKSLIKNYTREAIKVEKSEKKFSLRQQKSTPFLKSFSTNRIPIRS